MTVEAVLSRVEKLKRTGEGRWLCVCPAHPDKSPSLSIRDGGDGTTLLHCFAGCSVEAVLSALGLSFTDLFPERSPGERRPERRPFNPYDVLEAVCGEALVVAVTASDIRQGKQLSPEAYDRLLKANERLLAARDLALGVTPTNRGGQRGYNQAKR